MPPFEITPRRYYSPPDIGRGQSFARSLNPMASGAMGVGSSGVQKEAEKIMSRAVGVLNGLSEVKRNAREIKMETAESSFPGYSHLLQKYGIEDREANTAVSNEYGRTQSGVILINYGKMKEDFPNDEAAQRACLTLTILHELEHNYWGFSDLPLTLPGEKERIFRMDALNEGFTELLAMGLMQQYYPEEFAKRVDNAYADFAKVAQRLCGVIGSDKVQQAFFDRDSKQLFEEFEKIDRGKAITLFKDISKLSEDYDNGILDDGGIAAECNKLCKQIDWFGKKKGGFDSDRPTPSDSESRTERTGGYAGDRGGFDRGAVSSSQAEELSRTLINLNFENKAQLQKAEKMLWGFMAAGYRRYLGPIPTDCDPEVKLVAKDDIKSHGAILDDRVRGVYWERYNRIELDRDKLREIDQKRRILLLMHETGHALFFLKKRANGFDPKEWKLQYNLSEAVTNAIASEVFSHLYKEKDVIVDLWNFVILGNKILDILGEEKTYKWYFGPNAGLLFEDIRQKYGFGADLLLKAAAGHGDAYTTFIYMMLTNLERSKDKKTRRIIMPLRRVSYREFGSAYRNDRIKAINTVLERRIPGMTPYERYMLSGSIAYNSNDSYGNIDNQMKSAYELAENAATLNIQESKEFGWHLMESAYNPIIEAVVPDIKWIHLQETVLALSATSGDISQRAIKDFIKQAQFRSLEKSDAFLSQTTGWGENEQQRAIFREARSTLMEKGWETAALNPTSLKSFEIKDDGVVQPFSELGLAEVRVVGAVLVGTELNRNSASTIENFDQQIAVIRGINEIPAIVQYGDSKVVVPVPQTFTRDDINALPQILENIENYEVMKGYRSGRTDPQEIAGMVPASVDLVASIYAAAEQMAQRQYGVSAVQEIRRLFVAPDIQTINSIYQVSYYASECIPGRSFMGDSAF